MSDLSAVLDRLAQQAVAAAGPRILSGAPEPSDVYYLHVPGQPLTRCQAERRARCTLSHIQGMQQWLTSATAAALCAGHPEAASVWIDLPLHDGHLVITWITGHTLGAHHAKLELAGTEEAQFLVDYCAKPLSQRELVLALRTSLAKAAPAKLLPLVRQLKWTSGGNTGADLQHGKQSLDRSVVAAVMGADAIPEEITLQLQLTTSVPQRHPIRCALDIDTATQTFALHPLPEELEAARQAQLQWLKEFLTVPGGPEVFCGSPS